MLSWLIGSSLCAIRWNAIISILLVNSLLSGSRDEAEAIIAPDGEALKTSPSHAQESVTNKRLVRRSKRGRRATTDVFRAMSIDTFGKMARLQHEDDKRRVDYIWTEFGVKKIPAAFRAKLGNPNAGDVLSNAVMVELQANGRWEEALDTHAVLKVDQVIGRSIFVDRSEFERSSIASNVNSGREKSGTLVAVAIVLPVIAICVILFAWPHLFAQPTEEDVLPMHSDRGRASDEHVASTTGGHAKEKHSKKSPILRLFNRKDDRVSSARGRSANDPLHASIEEPKKQVSAVKSADDFLREQSAIQIQRLERGRQARNKAKRLKEESAQKKAPMFRLFRKTSPTARRSDKVEQSSMSPALDQLRLQETQAAPEVSIRSQCNQPSSSIPSVEQERLQGGGNADEGAGTARTNVIGVQQPEPAAMDPKLHHQLSEGDAESQQGPALSVSMVDQAAAEEVDDSAQQERPTKKRVTWAEEAPAAIEYEEDLETQYQEEGEETRTSENEENRQQQLPLQDTDENDHQQMQLQEDQQQHYLQQPQLDEAIVNQVEFAPTEEKQSDAIGDMSPTLSVGNMSSTLSEQTESEAGGVSRFDFLGSSRVQVTVSQSKSKSKARSAREPKVASHVERSPRIISPRPATANSRLIPIPTSYRQNSPTVESTVGLSRNSNDGSASASRSPRQNSSTVESTVALSRNSATSSASVPRSPRGQDRFM